MKILTTRARALAGVRRHRRRLAPVSPRRRWPPRPTTPTRSRSTSATCSRSWEHAAQPHRRHRPERRRSSPKPASHGPDVGRVVGGDGDVTGLGDRRPERTPAPTSARPCPGWCPAVSTRSTGAPSAPTPSTRCAPASSGPCPWTAVSSTAKAPAPNAFVAGATGTAAFHGRVDGDLLDAIQVFVSVVYHLFGRRPTRSRTWASSSPRVRPAAAASARTRMRQLLVLQKW